MAVTKCPECGGMVSTTVNKCIHCGTEFKVCPNCQTAVAASAAFCPECGSPIASAPHSAEVPLMETPPTQQYREEFAHRDQPAFPSMESILQSIKKPAGYYIFKTFHIISIVLSIICGVLFFIGTIISVIYSIETASLAPLVNLASYIFALAVVGTFAELWAGFTNLFLMIGVRRWSARNNINLPDVIKCGRNEYVENKEIHQTNLSIFGYACRVNNSAPSPVLPIIVAVIKIIHLFVLTPMLLSFLYMNARLIFTSPWSIGDYWGLPIAVIAVVVFVGFTVTTSVLQGHIKSSMEHHINNIAPSRNNIRYD